MFDTMYTAALLPDSTGLGTGSRRTEFFQPPRRLLRSVSAREIDLALADLVDEPVNRHEHLDGARHEHDHLAIDRHTRLLDPVWVEALLSILPRLF